MSEKDVPKGIKLIEINKYIEMRLKADPIFFYSDEANRSNISIMQLNGENSFTTKKPCKFLFYFF